MAGFFRLRENAKERRILKFLSCNNFSHAPNLSMKEKRMFDVLSFEGNSYYCERDAFKTKASDGNGLLPVLDITQDNVF